MYYIQKMIPFTSSEFGVVWELIVQSGKSQLLFGSWVKSSCGSQVAITQHDERSESIKIRYG